MSSLLHRLRILPKAVPNSGSTLRDHHANERTFLAWTRTGIGFAAMALALGRLEYVDRVMASTLSSNISTPPNPSSGHTETSLDIVAEVEKGITAPRVCQAISMYAFTYGLFRYVSVQRQLVKGLYVPGVWGPVVLTVGSLGIFGMLSVHAEKPLPDLKRLKISWGAETGAAGTDVEKTKE
ncbi:gb [Venturia nashicola]|uniref:Gb n=1 Tax=Venturia nashicola TaxID=86259 RepID=A0A4Z1P1U6_9PEZI|nr:gb [Venturia nashicola]TLD34813.1 gb [Venturia nashicola]